MFLFDKLGWSFVWFCLFCLRLFWYRTWVQNTTQGDAFLPFPSQLTTVVTCTVNTVAIVPGMSHFWALPVFILKKSRKIRSQINAGNFREIAEKSILFGSSRPCFPLKTTQPYPTREAKRLDWKMFGWARNSTIEKSATMGTMATMARVESSDSMPTQAIQGTNKPWEPRHKIKVAVLNGSFLKLLLASCRSVAPLNWLPSKNVCRDVAPHSIR